MTNVVVARDCPAVPSLPLPSSPPLPPSSSPSTIRNSQPNRFLMESMRSTTRRPLDLFTDSWLPLGGCGGPASIVRRGNHVSVIGTARGHAFCTRTKHRSVTGGRTRKSSCQDGQRTERAPRDKLRRFDRRRFFYVPDQQPRSRSRYRLLLFLSLLCDVLQQTTAHETKIKLLRLIRLDYHKRIVTARATSRRVVLLSSPPFCYCLARAQTSLVHNKASILRRWGVQ